METLNQRVSRGRELFGVMFLFRDSDQANGPYPNMPEQEENIGLSGVDISKLSNETLIEARLAYKAIQSMICSIDSTVHREGVFDVFCQYSVLIGDVRVAHSSLLRFRFRGFECAFSILEPNRALARSSLPDVFDNVKCIIRVRKDEANTFLVLPRSKYHPDPFAIRFTLCEAESLDTTSPEKVELLIN